MLHIKILPKKLNFITIIFKLFFNLSLKTVIQIYFKIDYKTERVFIEILINK